MAIDAPVMSLSFFKSLVVDAASSEPGNGATTFIGLHKILLLDPLGPLAEIGARDTNFVVPGNKHDAWWAMKSHKFYNHNKTPNSMS